MSALIEISGLTKRFGAFTAVDELSLSVDRGEVLGFLGPNGAGKSTTMKMVAGFLEPTSGTAHVAGYDVTRDSVLAKRHLGYLPEGAPSYGDMTPQSFLEFVARVRGFDGEQRRRRIEHAVERCELTGVLSQPIDTLSKGFSRRLGLAQAIVHEPEVLILDEPTDGLDPNQKRHVRGLITEMAANTAIIVSTHILEEVDAVCSRAVIVNRGRIVLDDTPQNLLASASDYGSITIVTDAALAHDACAAMAPLPEVRGVNARIGRDGAVRLEITSVARRDATPVVAGLFRENGWPVHELHTNEGSLEQVFWAATEAAEATSGE